MAKMPSKVREESTSIDPELRAVETMIYDALHASDYKVPREIGSWESVERTNERHDTLYAGPGLVLKVESGHEYLITIERKS